MTRRERLENKLAKREAWAGKADARSAAAFDGAHALASAIPFGQPILVGHHSEGRARRDAERIRSGMDRGCAEGRLASDHRSKARGLAIALERSVFSDDADAIARLESRIAESEAEAERRAAINKAWRRGGADAVRALAGDRLAAAAAETMRAAPWLKSPLDTSSARASIRRDRERIAEIRARQARAAAAADAGGVTIADRGAFAVVTFAEKPDRTVLEALRGAGFYWSRGSWIGERSKLPIDAAGSVVGPNVAQ